MQYQTGCINFEAYHKMTIQDPLLKNYQEFQEVFQGIKARVGPSEQGALDDHMHHRPMKLALTATF